MRYVGAVILLLALASVFSVRSAAQPRSVGGLFSFSGIDVSYQHQASDSTFFEISAGIDLCGVLDGSAMYPGAKAGFSYNFVFWDHEFESGLLSTYAGIGFAAGYVRQTNGIKGPMAALLGKIGLEYAFRVPVILSVDFSPLLGMQIDGTATGASLRMYIDGLSKAFYPKLGIRYCF